MTFFGIIAFSSFKSNAANCNQFINGNEQETKVQYSIYYEYFKKGLYTDAYPAWKNLYNNAPGFRLQTFLDGEAMYKQFIKEAKDDATKAALEDTLMQILTKGIECHNSGYLYGQRAYNYVAYKNDAENAKKDFQKYMELEKDNAYHFYLKTYYSVLRFQYDNKAISDDEMKAEMAKINQIADNNIKKNKYTEEFKALKEYLENQYNELFLDVTTPEGQAKTLVIIKEQFAKNPTDENKLLDIYNLSLKTNDSLFSAQVLEKLHQLFPANLTYTDRLALKYIKADNLNAAKQVYVTSANAMTDTLKKAEIYLALANLAYEEDDFGASRDYAKMAIANNPAEGKAYFWIGYLYTASGSKCGPGVGFQSQIVLWPAFDYLKQAVAYGDATISAEAQKLMDDYRQYLPTVQDVKDKKLKVGQAYTVKCWINETTTVQVK